MMKKSIARNGLSQTNRMGMSSISLVRLAQSYYRLMSSLESSICRGVRSFIDVQIIRVRTEPKIDNRVDR